MIGVFGSEDFSEPFSEEPVTLFWQKASSVETNETNESFFVYMIKMLNKNNNRKFHDICLLSHFL